MPRKPHRNLCRGQTPRIVFATAAAAARLGVSARSAANVYGFDRMSLRMYFDKLDGSLEPYIRGTQVTGRVSS